MMTSSLLSLPEELTDDERSSRIICEENVLLHLAIVIGIPLIAPLLRISRGSLNQYIICPF